MRYSPASTLLLFVVVVGLILGHALLRGADPFVVGVLLLAVLGGGWMALQSARFALAAGQGWLSVRGVIRHRWVRTDQLVQLKDGPVGVDRILTLRDADGRSIGVQLSVLSRVPQARTQALRDLRTSMAAGLEVSAVTRERLGL